MRLNLNILFSIFFIFLLNAGNTLFAQKDIKDTIQTTTSKNDKVDIVDRYRLITKKTVRPLADSTKKKLFGPFYTPVFYPGYAMVTGYNVGLANSISFYSHHHDSAKISTVLIENIYSQYKQFFNLVRSTMWFYKDKINLLGDWRYYKFPTNTFGLGGKTTFDDKDAVDYSHLRLSEIIMLRIAKHLGGGMGLGLDYHWNIRETNYIVKYNTDLDKYGLKRTSLSSGISFNFQFDSRFNSNNPYRGFYASLQLRNNLKVLGSDNDWQSATLDMRYYIPVFKKQGNVLALWSYSCFTLSGTTPYFDLPSTGCDTYNNMARGYVEGRFRGLNLVYAEAEYRFRLTKNRLLGGVLFSNVSTLTEWASNKFEKLIPGAGFGLRIKLNKFSDTNLCIDYGFGLNGSRGLAFNINEVF